MNDTGFLPNLVVSKNEFEKLAKDRELSYEPMKVLLYLMSKVGSSNDIGVSQKQVRETLKMQKASVSRIVRLLIGKKIIEEVSDAVKEDGRNKIYRLDKNYVFCDRRVKNDYLFKPISEKRGKNGLTHKHLLASKDLFEKLAIEREVTCESIRVLLYFMSKMDSTGHVPVNQNQICEALHMQRPNVSRAAKLLITKNIIEAKKDGRSKIYKLPQEKGQSTRSTESPIYAPIGFSLQRFFVSCYSVAGSEKDLLRNGHPIMGHYVRRKKRGET